MSQFQISETNKKTEAEVPEGYELLTDKAPHSYDINPSEILIQCLHRPFEAIHTGIIDSSYTWVDKGSGWQRITDPFGGWVHISRNWQTLQFLKRKEFKYLLLIDSDESIPWWVPFQLAEADKAIISGVICGYTAERGLFACVAVKGEDGRAQFPSINNTKTLPASGLGKVHNAGTGCLMIRRDVLQAMWDKWEEDPSFGQPFSIPQAEQDQAAIQGAMPRGEDICFTDRARELGYEIWVDWACKGGHLKPFNIAWPEQAVTNMSPEKWARLAFPKAQTP